MDPPKGDEVGKSGTPSASRLSLKVPHHGDCQVCMQQAHGMHFGVLSCRACAAFFRRTVVLKRKYACRRANGSCEITKDERYICRQCRYNKCIELGMTVDNVQWNRDTLKMSEKVPNKDVMPPVPIESDSVSQSAVPELPQLDDISAKPLDVQERTRTFQDMATNTSVIKKSLPFMLSGNARNQPLDNAAKLAENVTFTKNASSASLQFSMEHMSNVIREIFTTFNADLTCPEVRNESTLMRMHSALNRHRQHQKYELKYLDSINLLAIYPFWETHFCRIGEWFMFSREFTSIPIEEKIALFRNSCYVWQRLERLQMSIEIFGQDVLKDRVMVLSDEHAANMQKMTIDYSSISDYDADYFKSIFNPIFDRVFSEVVRPMLEMQLTKIELTYMLCQLGFHIEGRQLSEQTHQMSILFRNRVSDDLHEYYTNTMNQPNYANRLIRLMTIIHAMESIQNEKAKVMELARIFDVIKTDISL